MMNFFKLCKTDKSSQPKISEAESMVDLQDIAQPSPILPDELMCVDSVPMTAVACMCSWPLEY